MWENHLTRFNNHLWRREKELSANRREFPQTDKRHIQKNIQLIFNNEKAFLLRWGTSNEVCSHHLYSTLYWRHYGPNILQCACVIIIIDNFLHTYNAIITLKNNYFVSPNTISGFMVLFTALEKNVPIWILSPKPFLSFSSLAIFIVLFSVFRSLTRVCLGDFWGVYPVWSSFHSLNL